MKYYLGDEYNPVTDVNINSWAKITRLYKKKRAVEFDALVHAVKGHDRRGGAKGFVLYLIRHEWVK